MTPVGRLQKMKEAAEKEKTNLSNNNIASTAYTSNNNNNAPRIPAPVSSGNTQIPMYPSQPHMFYYQPFRPQVGGINPPSIYPLHPYGYINPYQQQPVPMPMQMNPQPHYSSVPVYPVFPPVLPVTTPTEQKPPIPQNSQFKTQPQKPHSQPKKPMNTSNSQSHANISSVVSTYNLDDPEELEKWKAERRKKFPSGKKEAEASSPVETKEEGALSEFEDSVEEPKTGQSAALKRKRTCKYFARGKCTKGDSCQFEHISISVPKSKRSNTTTSGTSRPTIFENLLKIEEKETMIKFYECIKLIIQK